MHSFLAGLCIAVGAQAVMAAPNTDIVSTVHAKLAGMHQYSADRTQLNKVVVLPFANHTPVAGAEKGLDAATRDILSTAGYDVLPDVSVQSYIAAHGNAPWSESDLYQLSQALGAGAVVVGAIEKFRSKKGFGIPLPYMWQANHADVVLSAEVYQSAAGKVVWKDEAHHKTRDFILGGMKSRDSTRRKVRTTALDSLMGRYVKAHPAHSS